MNKKELEMREEARKAIIEALEGGYSEYYGDLHDEIFNTDYYIIGTYKAKKALEEYGVWNAIEKVQTYDYGKEYLQNCKRASEVHNSPSLLANNHL